MICKSIKAVMLISVITASNYLQAQTSVPVTDTTTQTLISKNTTALTKTINNASTQVATQVSTTGKIISSMLTEVNRQAAERQAKEMIAQSQRRNAERFAVSFGAKTKDGCAMVRSSVALQKGQISQQRITKSLVNSSNVYYQRGRFRSPNEPAGISDAASLLTRYKKINAMEKSRAQQDEGSLIDSTIVYSATPDANGNTEAGLAWQSFQARMEPFAETVPVDYDHPSQPAAGLIRNAHAKWKHEMMSAVSSNAAIIHGKKTALIDDAWAKYMFTNTTAGAQMKNLALGTTGKQSFYSTMEALNKARLYSPDWMKYTNVDAGEKALLADSNLIGSTMLVNQQEIIRLLMIIAENGNTSFMNDMRYYWSEKSTQN